MNRMINNKDFDFQDRDIKTDLQNIESELKKKRFISNNNKKEF